MSGSTAPREPPAEGRDESGPTCLICGGDRWARTLSARERQFGLPGAFRYAQCARCDSLQLLDVPADLGAYYPAGYYSFDVAPARGVGARLKGVRDRSAVTGHGTLGRLLAVVQPPPAAGLHRWLQLAGVGPDSRILDVGCGGGALLHTLAAAGYRDLTGVDPFLDGDRRAGIVRLLRRTVEALDETFDLVMMHHALEHVPDPAATVRALRARCRSGAHCLVRVPIAPSAAFRRYGERWVQLDAPRHLVIPSERGLIALAERAGFALVSHRQDSTAIQWWGSALYAGDGLLSVDGARVGWVGRQRGRLRAWRANARGEGDQAAFLFRAA